MHRIVVAGGGFAGMWAAAAAKRQAELSNTEVAVTLVSPNTHLTLRPRLYEADPANMAVPLAATLDPVGVQHLIASVTALEPAGRTLIADTAEGKQSVEYDRLVLALGSQLRDPGIPGLAAHGFDVDTIEGAIRLDSHLQGLGEQPVVIILGGGFSGIELALEMRSRIATHHGADAAERARVILIDAAAVGNTLGANAQPAIMAALVAARVECIEDRLVRSVSEVDVSLDDGTSIQCTTVVNTVGMAAHPLAESLDVARTPDGRILVDDNLKAADAIFAAGDIAAAHADDEHLTLMSCQHAMPMGKCAGANAVLDLLDKSLLTYRQPDYVTCLDLGQSGALFTQGWDRNVVMTGADAKALKQQINTRWIYPPQYDAEQILAAAAMDWHPSQAA